jgi:hypothetical protein
MHRTPVDSRAVTSVGYDPSLQVLEIEYKPAGVYDYFDVPLEVFEKLLVAESIGEYVNGKVKPYFDFQKVD